MAIVLTNLGISYLTQAVLCSMRLPLKPLTVIKLDWESLSPVMVRLPPAKEACWEGTLVELFNLTLRV